MAAGISRGCLLYTSMLSAPVKDGKAILEELTGQRKEEAEDDDLDWDCLLYTSRCV